MKSFEIVVSVIVGTLIPALTTAFTVILKKLSEYKKEVYKIDGLIKSIKEKDEIILKQKDIIEKYNILLEEKDKIIKAQIKQLKEKDEIISQQQELIKKAGK